MVFNNYDGKMVTTTAEKELSEKFEKIENIIEDDKQPDKDVENNLTISTKLSTDQLICKTPRESPSGSIKSLSKDGISEKCSVGVKKCSVVLYLGALQIFLGLLMAIFGILVIVHRASLSQIGGGIWGGCVVTATGISGLVAVSKQWCPLKETAQRVAHTVYLALSLISLAVSQLVLVVAATGLGRDMNTNIETISFGQDETDKVNGETIYSNSLPSNYLAVLSNIGLIVVSALECVCAAIISYKEARILCPCFRNDIEEDERLKCNMQISNHARDALVSSWLGKHNPPPLYIVAAAAPSTLSSKRSKLSVTPIFALPPPPMLQPPTMMGYPLIPAPLGQIPSPIIRPHPKELVYKRVRKHHKGHHTSKHARKHSKSKSKERVITTEDVARTYTGLDRTIAEEFIEICDSHNTSLCSDSSCQSSCCQSSCQGSACQCQSACTACTTACTNSTDAVSREYMEKM